LRFGKKGKWLGGEENQKTKPPNGGNGVAGQKKRPAQYACGAEKKVGVLLTVKAAVWGESRITHTP